MPKLPVTSKSSSRGQQSATLAIQQGNLSKSSYQGVIKGYGLWTTKP